MAGGMVTVKVWDGWVRLFHWSTVLLLIASYVTAKLRWIEWHMLSGGLLLGLVLFRLAWGVVGSETARFAQFLAGPRAASGCAGSSTACTRRRRPCGQASCTRRAWSRRRR